MMKCATAARFAEVFIRVATKREVVGVPGFAPSRIGIATVGVISPFWVITTTSPVVTEPDWKMVVIINPKAIWRKTVSIMPVSSIS
ncbi:MAG: hypothetical protein PHN79_03470 [Methanoregula sp.]|nr:hypothetical protein [Methanoregula sp.]